MSPVEFKKRPCRPVEFKGQGPSKGTDISNRPYTFFEVEDSFPKTATRKSHGALKQNPCTRGRCCFFSRLPVENERQLSVYPVTMLY